MKIAQIAPLWIPVPPLTYGGTELIVSWLTEELIKRGHKITLFASGDSKTSARLIPFGEKSLWRMRAPNPHAWYSLMLNEVLKLQNDFDIIHNHTEFYFAPFSKFIKIPTVSTLHRPLSYETIQVFKNFPEIHYVAVSHDQELSGYGYKFKASNLIYHGIPVNKYPFEKNPDNYLVWLSKIIPEKGILEAVEVAKRSDEKLLICGNIAPGQEHFFRYEVAPLIDKKQIVYLGQANFRKKIKILSRAKALLYPIRRREPFGLAMVEAMACGTPVIAFHEGSVPEIVENKKTGFVVKNIQKMIVRLKHINEIDRKECRRHVEENFNLKKMTDSYEKLYQEILKTE